MSDTLFEKLESRYKAVCADRDRLEKELAEVRRDFAALQHALVGNTGASAILTAERLRAAAGTTAKETAV